MELNKNQNNNLQEQLLNNETENDGEYNFDKESLIGKEQEFLLIQIRLGFIRKVFGILTIQLAISSLFIILGFNDTMKIFFLTNLLIFYLSIFLSISLALILICFPKLVRRVPINYVILGIWTLCEAYLIGVISSLYDTYSILFAASLTVVVTLSLTVYAYNTKRDITYYGGFLYVTLSIITFFGLFFILFGFNNKFMNFLHFFSLILGVILYSFYLIYDIQLLVGKYGLNYSIDDYVIAAMMIYIDILQIFINLLELIGTRRN